MTLADTITNILRRPTLLTAVALTALTTPATTSTTAHAQGDDGNGGLVACWGTNSNGQCNVPSEVGTPENPIVQVASGHRHTVALLADGSVAGWEKNVDGQSDVPSGIGTPENPVIAVAASAYHAIALFDGCP